MGQVKTLPLTIKEWECYFTNRSNTREQPGHGGGSRLDWFEEFAWRRDPSVSGELRVHMYSNMVQAILNCWTKLTHVKREAYESDPITTVAGMAFVDDAQRTRTMDEKLRPFYNRLWQESPRPHNKSLLQMAINAYGQLPVSEQDICQLFEQKGWAIVACRLALEKGCTNLAIELFDDLRSKPKETNFWLIKDLVDLGMDKVKAIRVVHYLYPKEPTAIRSVEVWENELLASGFKHADIYG